MDVSMKYLQQIKNHLPEIAFVALLIHSLILGCGIGEAFVLISLVISSGYKQWLEKSKVDEKVELETKLANLTDDLHNLMNANLSVRIDEAMSKIDNISSAVQLRNTRNDQQAPPTVINGKAKKYF